ncbi:MAG: hypothetical protein LBC68_03430 [Prevotellaceae bacterium]|nr:hypothetical protein [Prevotellaceae bacterium]
MSRGAATVFQVSDNNPREIRRSDIMFLPTYRSYGTAHIANEAKSVTS